MEQTTTLILAFFVAYGLPLMLLLLGLFVGRAMEKRHYHSIHEREKTFLAIPAVTSKSLSDSRKVADVSFVIGAVVISVDHFKRFLMFFRRIFGGEIRSYASLIDRGRREALLRMKESCPKADLFLNCRMETATLFSGTGKATGCVEVVAYATAITFEK